MLTRFLWGFPADKRKGLRMNVVTSNVVVTYTEEIRDPDLRKRLNMEFRTRWGYITSEVFELYKKMASGQMDEKEADTRYIVFLPDGVLANVALAHMRVVDPFAVVELVKRESAVVDSEPSNIIDAKNVIVEKKEKSK
jgi:hypothetical protein